MLEDDKMGVLQRSQKKNYSLLLNKLFLAFAPLRLRVKKLSYFKRQFP